MQTDPRKRLDRLITQLDAVFAEEGGTDRYHVIRDEIFALVDQHPELAPDVQDVIPY